MKLLLISLSLIFCAEALASSCESVDLRSPVLGPPRHQDSILWCSSIAAADMLSHKTGKRISATDVALEYNSKHKDQYKSDGTPFKSYEQQYGDAPINAQTALDNGLCLEEKLPSGDFGNVELYDLLKKIEDYKEKLDTSKGENCPPLGSNYISLMFPSMGSSTFFDIAFNSQAAYFFDELADKACVSRFTPKPKLTARSYKKGRKHSPDDLLDKVDSQLDQSNIVSIGYDGRLLTGGGNKWGHDSTIVGRRTNKETGKCEYLIRNSYGRSCNGYNSRFECEEGNIYVPKDEIKKWIWDIGYII